MLSQQAVLNIMFVSAFDSLSVCGENRGHFLLPRDNYSAELVSDRQGHQKRIDDLHLVSGQGSLETGRPSSLLEDHRFNFDLNSRLSFSRGSAFVCAFSQSHCILLVILGFAADLRRGRLGRVGEEGRKKHQRMINIFRSGKKV